MITLLKILKHDIKCIKNYTCIDEKSNFFIDGFNLYYSLANNRLGKYKWLDLRSLAEKFITKKQKRECSFPLFVIARSVATRQSHTLSPTLEKHIQYL